MGKFILLASMVIVLVGTVAIYGSRNIVKHKLKNVKNENKVVLNLKIVGYILVIIGLIMLYIITR